MEKIIAINEIYGDEGKRFCREMSGFEVVTDKQSIKLLIQDYQDCCEIFGYFWCNEDPNDFIGAELLDIKIADTALNEAIMEKNDLNPNNQYFEGDVMFVNLETSKGLMQFVAYNKHNGYYGHMAKVVCKQLEYSEIL